MFRIEWSCFAGTARRRGRQIFYYIYIRMLVVNEMGTFTVSVLLLCQFFFYILNKKTKSVIMNSSKLIQY